MEQAGGEDVVEIKIKRSKIGEVYTQYMNLTSPKTFENRNRFSFRQKALSDDDAEFLRIIKAGDSQELVYYLQAHPNVNYNSCDTRGLRALEIAVLDRDEDMIDILLSMGHFSEAHLQGAAVHAVMENEPVILKDILDAFEKAQEERQGSPEDETDRMLPSLTFNNECVAIDPIMAAASNGNLEITQMLLARGHFVRKPHPLKCKCDKCYDRDVGMESLSQSLARINSYKALSNPVYIALTSDDPILTAFELSAELDFLANELPEHKSIYKELKQQCSKFAADLLNECCETSEVQIVLSQRKGFPDPRPREFSRLHLAVQYDQKEFVTHPSCQQVLRSMWVEGLSIWWRWSMWHRVFHVVKHALLFPLLSLSYIIFPIPWVVKQVKIPLNRFIHCAASYMVFLSLILATLVTGKSDGPKSKSLPIDVMVGIYIYSYFWEIMVSMYLLGVRTSLRSWWSVYDLVMFSLFLISEILWLVSFINNRELNGFYSMSRNSWPWYHPYLIGEGIYAIASILAFMKLMLWYQLSARLGPLSTSLKRMVGDVFRFLLIIVIVMFAFATGINSLYKNYGGNVQVTEEGEKRHQPEEFVKLHYAAKTLFWGVFGLGAAESADLVVNGNETDRSIPHHMYTEVLGYSLWGVYHLLTMVILVNMLVAMMADSYQRVKNNSDKEWKFGRGSLWLAFMDSHTTIPPPFNLIPTAWGIKTSLTCLKTMFSRNITRKITPYEAMQECCFWDTESQRANDKLQEERYQRLMVHLIHRYLQKNNRRDSQYIPQDIIDKLKMELLIDFRKSLRKSRSKKSLIE